MFIRFPSFCDEMSGIRIVWRPEKIENLGCRVLAMSHCVGLGTHSFIFLSKTRNCIELHPLHVQKEKKKKEREEVEGKSINVEKSLDWSVFYWI
ncbi:hypothetical protein SCA6_019299 [Theobroma cacao]